MQLLWRGLGAYIARTMCFDVRLRQPAGDRSLCFENPFVLSVSPPPRAAALRAKALPERFVDMKMLRVRRLTQHRL